MIKSIEEKLLKIPIINWLVRIGKRIKIPGLEGLSVYDLIELYVIGIVKGALTSRAGGIAFSFFMALFPFLLFVITLIPYVPIEGFQEDFRLMITRLLPPNTADSVFIVISDIANNKYGSSLSVVFIASIFLMTNGINAIFGGFEYSYHVKVTRNIIKQYFVALGVSIFMAMILLLTVAMTVFFEIGIQDLKSSGWVDDDVLWIQLGRYAFFVLMVFISVSVLFFYGTKDLKHLSFFSAGSVFTTLLTLLLFYLFGIYVERFARYNELYGSIGTLLIIMLFIWLNSIILLLGFELNASMNRLKKRHFGKE